MLTQIPHAALRAVHDRVLQAAQTIVATGVEAAPQFFVMQVDAEGEVLHAYAMPEYLMRMFFGQGAEGKNKMAYVLHEMTTPGSEMRDLFISSHGFEPNLLVQVNEAWMFTAAKDVDMSKVAPPSEDPNRKEVLLIALHTMQSTLPVMHAIEQNPRHVVRGTFPEENAGEYRGRFVRQSNFDTVEQPKAPAPAGGV